MMNTSKMWPETIVSGFFYLTALIFWAIRLLELDPQQIGALFSTIISPTLGALGIVSALTFSGAYLVGHIAGRLLTDLTRLVKRLLDGRGRPQRTAPSDPEDLRLVALLPKDALATELHGRWVAKYFYRSMFGGVFFVLLASAPWTVCSEVSQVRFTAWVLGITVEIALLIAFITQRRSHISLVRAIDSPA